MTKNTTAIDEAARRVEAARAVALALGAHAADDEADPLEPAVVAGAATAVGMLLGDALDALGRPA